MKLMMRAFVIVLVFCGSAFASNVNTASIPFGPTNDFTRGYSFQTPAVPNADWCMVFQFRVDQFRGNRVEFLYSDILSTGTGGNDFYIGYAGKESSQVPTANRGKVFCYISRGGVNLTSAEVVSNTTIQQGVTYWLVFQRTGANVELWVVPAGTASPAVDKTAAYNNLGAQTLINGYFGINSRATIGCFFMAKQALTSGDIGNLATGTDPDTIVSTVGNRLCFLSFNSTGTITGSWGGNNAVANGPFATGVSWSNASPNITLNAGNPSIAVGQTVTGNNIAGGTTVASISGTALVLSQNPSGSSASGSGSVLAFGGSATVWANREVSGQLQASSSVSQLKLTEFRPGTCFGKSRSGGNTTVSIAGTYANYTPSAIDYQIVKFADQSVVTAWSAVSSFSASAGAFTGTISMPPGGPYYIWIRDRTTNSITYQSINIVSCCPVVVTMGQSPIVMLDTSYQGLGSLNGSYLHGWYPATNGYGVAEPFGIRQNSETGIGVASAYNQLLADGSSDPFCFIGGAVVGTSIYDWTGVQTVTLSGTPSPLYTVGETVTITGSTTASATGSSGTQSITLGAGNTAINVGMSVSGTGIPAGATVFSISGTALTINLLTNAAVSGTLTFTGSTTGIVTASSGTSLTVKYSGMNTGTGWTITGQTSGATQTVATKSTLGTQQISLCYPPFLAAIDAMGLKNCDVMLNWLNGAADENFNSAGTYFDLLMARLTTDMTSRGLNWTFTLLPHNRESGTSVANVIRSVQWLWAVGRSDYGSMVFTGPPSTDWQTVPESIGKSPTAVTNNTITLAADNDFQLSDQPNTITIVSGTGAGQTRTISGYVVATKVATVSVAWSPNPDTNSTYNCWNSSIGSPHPNRFGAALLGTRLGRYWANQFGYTTTPYVGHTLARATIPAGGDGTVIDVWFSHPQQGRAIRTANNGRTANNVAGFSVSTDRFATTKTISNVTILSPNRVRITLSGAPGSLSTLTLRYLDQHPIAPASVADLNNVLLDDSGLGVPSGIATYFTPVDVVVKQSFAAAL